MASLGNLLRLQPLHIDELPEHPTLRSADSASASRPTLRDFVTRSLAEASEFTENTVIRNFASKGKKNSPPSAAGVELLSHSYSREQMQQVNYDDTRMPRHLSGQGDKPAEFWFGRRSIHANHNEEGTADWSEFDRCIRELHSEYEKEYTPGIYDAHEVLNWNDQLRTALKSGSIDGSFGKFSDIRMSLREMCHQLPFPLSPRTFSVVVLSAKGPGARSVIVVQLPVDLRKLDAAVYSNRLNVTETKGRSHLEKTPTVQGIYTSVERCTLTSDGNIEWLMATASDARGWLPMWMQKLGTPGAIVKDVGLFMKYMKKERGGQGLQSKMEPQSGKQ